MVAAEAASSPLEARCNLRGKCLAEYIFLGGSGGDLRSRTRVLGHVPTSAAECPLWTVDGTYTDQAPADRAVLYLQPREVYPDPFRAGTHVLVLCDVLAPPPLSDSGDMAAAAANAQPHPSNNRAPAAAVMAAAAGSEPLFEVQQQYLLLDATSRLPLGCKEQLAAAVVLQRPPEDDSRRRPSPQRRPLEEPHHARPPENSQCLAGDQPEAAAAAQPARAFCLPGMVTGRQIAESHLRACLHAGLKITGMQAEAVAGQWSYTLGACAGIQAGDQLWVSRYLLHRLAENFGVIASLDPKPVPGEWGGSGAAVTFSTRATRQPDRGWFEVQRCVMALAATHLQHITVYGAGNDRRLTASPRSRTSALLDFSWGVDAAAASVTVPHAVLLERRGGLTDRRPGANMDPYLVSMMLVATCCGVALPTGPKSGGGDSGMHSEALSADILNEMEALETLAPDTPRLALKGFPAAANPSCPSAPSEVSVDNFGGSSGGSHNVLSRAASGSFRRASASGSGSGSRSGSGRGRNASGCARGGLASGQAVGAGGKQQRTAQGTDLAQQQPPSEAAGPVQGAKWEATALQATLDAGSCDIQRRHIAQQARLHLHRHSPVGSVPATLERCSSSAIPVPAAAAGVEMAAAFPDGAAIDMDLEASPTGCSPPSFGHQVRGGSFFRPN